ncbi:MAG TPA: WG repeat-containing protein [Pyrinomonadaceae bacterium]|nr:WG repeat-containing protein [Pyrinomonadaceae bacterium]
MTAFIFYALLAVVIVGAYRAPEVHAQEKDEPLFPVFDEERGRTIYIDRTGKAVLTVPYPASGFSEGLARVTVNRQTGYIDRTGKLVIGPIPYGGRDFSNGLAMVEGGERCTYAETKQKYGYIDRTGSLVIPVTLTRPCNYWGDDFYFTKEGLALTNVGDKWGFIDRTGKLVMQFDDAARFSEGLAAAKVNGKFGYIDSKGKFVIKPAFDQALRFAEGRAAVRVKDLWGFIDKRGKFVVAPKYKEAQGFSEGLATVLVDQKKWEWATIDRSGKIVIPARQNGATHFSNGLSRITVDRENGFIDKSGKMVIEPNYFHAEDFRGGLAFVIDAESGRRSYIDTTGKIVYQFPERKGPPPDPKNPFVRISNATDVEWLERIVSSPAAAAELRPGGGLANHAKDLRTAAYVRLGTLGTPESLAAIKRIETEARKIYPAPAQSTPGDFIHPGWHYSDSELRPLAQVRNADGITYGIVVSSLMGDLDLFLISSRTPEDPSSWSRPLLIPNKLYRGIKQPQLTAEGAGELVFSFVQEPPPGRALMEGTHDPGPAAPALGPQQWKLSIEQIQRDSDADGWTDVEEERLGIDPKKKDSDGDGIPDGQDVCPNFSLNDEAKNDEEIEIFQKAVFVTFGLSGSRHLLLVNPQVKRVHLWGYAGPVIYGQDVQSWSKNPQYGAVYVSWRIRKRQSNGEVVVEITDYEGPLAAGGQDVRLRKINNEWVVVSRRTTWVS